MPRTKLFLIPNTLGEQANIKASIPEENKQIVSQLRVFAVEHIKDARRLLVKMGLKALIDQSEFFEIHKNREADIYQQIIEKAKAGNDVGIISDAGCPGIADPGAELAKLAHQHQIQVVPLVGPSSILLALISSGLNGQSFAFHGYLDREKDKRSAAIRKLEQESKQKNQTQLFMETPYRNEALFEDLLKTLQPYTLLSIACNLSLPDEYIQTKTIGDWKKAKKMDIQKKPVIFSLLA